jgi:hypothetical protein
VTLLTERLIRHITEKQMLLSMGLMSIQVTLENQKKIMTTFNIRKTEFEHKVYTDQTNTAVLYQIPLHNPKLCEHCAKYIYIYI